MKVKFWHDNNANIHSTYEETFDTYEDFGMTDDEWNALSEDEKYKLVSEWALQMFDYGYEELKK